MSISATPPSPVPMRKSSGVINNEMGGLTIPEVLGWLLTSCTVICLSVDKWAGTGGVVVKCSGGGALGYSGGAIDRVFFWIIDIMAFFFSSRTSSSSSESDLYDEVGEAEVDLLLN